MDIFAKTSPAAPPAAGARADPRRGKGVSAAAAGVALLVALPGVATAYTSFQSGGFFVGTPAVLAVVVGLVLVARITLANAPFAGLGRAAGVATVALGLYCAWVLLSASWSDAPARAMIEFDRALLYWLVLVLLASVPRDDRRLAWATRGVVVAVVGVCAAALATRLFPNLLDLSEAIANERLNYPLTYWNSLGLLAGIAAVLLMHLTSSEREAAVTRVAAAGALPIVAGTLYFTFSRGAIAATVLAAVIYLAFARPRGFPVALLTVGPPVAAVLVAAYGADVLAGDRPTSPAAATAGGEVALVVAVAVLGAGALRWVGLLADRRLARVSIAGAARHRMRVGVAVTAALAIGTSVAAFDAPGVLGDQLDRFVEGGTPSGTSDFRGRLTSVSNNGRIEQWEIALQGFAENPITGDGAGAFVHRWNRERSGGLKVVDAHSLYAETLSELGIVGIALLLVAIGAISGGFAAGLRRGERHLYAALLAVGVGWAAHAGIDWDWEMPAVSLWIFALGGMALARPAGGDSGPTVSRSARVAIGVACLALIVTPAQMALSQQHLNTAVEALKSGDCEAASEAALHAAEATSVRPEPYEILGYCNSSAGDHVLARQMMRTAIDREPESWEAHYGLALVTAAAGQDPRPATRAAVRLNQHDPLVEDAARRFLGTDDPERWRRRALGARLPIL